MAVDTRTALLESATALVRRRGYAGFSYADLAEVIPIRKPSIHHHFPTKEDLGIAIVERYAERFMAQLAAIDAAQSDTIAKIRAYADLYREGLSTGQGCLCGVLASEIGTLPARVQAGVRRFFDDNLSWLERVLREGKRRGLIRPDLRAPRAARTVLAALQGALFLALSLGDKRAFNDAESELLTGLRAAP